MDPQSTANPTVPRGQAILKFHRSKHPSSQVWAQGRYSQNRGGSRARACAHRNSRAAPGTAAGARYGARDATRCHARCGRKQRGAHDDHKQQQHHHHQQQQHQRQHQHQRELWQSKLPCSHVTTFKIVGNVSTPSVVVGPTAEMSVRDECPIYTS